MKDSMWFNVMSVVWLGLGVYGWVDNRSQEIIMLAVLMSAVYRVGAVICKYVE